MPVSRTRIVATPSLSVRLKALALVGALLSGGCASYQGYPPRYSKIDADLGYLGNQYDAKSIAACEERKDVVCRDRIVHSAIRAVDLQFDHFRQKLFRSSGALNLGSDLVVLGLSAGGALLVPATTKAILAGISGAVTGSKASIDKNLLFDKTVLVLLGRMEALRKAALVTLYGNLRKDQWNQYSLSEALVDVETYYNAGTIPAAIISINAETGEKETAAEGKLQELRK